MIYSAKYFSGRLIIMAITILSQSCAYNDSPQVNQAANQAANIAAEQEIVPEVAQDVMMKDGNRRVALGRVVDRPLELIAGDLVDALVQIPQYRSGTTVFQPIPVSGFDKAVNSALQDKGLVVVVTNRRIGTNVVTAFEDSTNEQQTHVITVGEVALKRSYVVLNNKVTPTSSLFVRGIDSNNIRLDDRKFLSNLIFKHSS